MQNDDVGPPHAVPDERDARDAPGARRARVRHELAPRVRRVGRGRARPRGGADGRGARRRGARRRLRRLVPARQGRHRPDLALGRDRRRRRRRRAPRVDARGPRGRRGAARARDGRPAARRSGPLPRGARPAGRGARIRGRVRGAARAPRALRRDQKRGPLPARGLDFIVQGAALLRFAAARQRLRRLPRGPRAGAGKSARPRGPAARRRLQRVLVLWVRLAGPRDDGRGHPRDVAGAAEVRRRRLRARAARAVLPAHDLRRRRLAEAPRLR